MSALILGLFSQKIKAELMTASDNILERSYSDRQLIVITKDSVADAARNEAEPRQGGHVHSALTLLKQLKNWKTTPPAATKDWKMAAAKGAATGVVASTAIITSLPATAVVAVPVAAIAAAIPLMGLISAASQVGRAWYKAAESGVEVVLVGKTAAKSLQFPPGHPRERVLYVGHPVLPHVYYPMAEFHRVTFEHKFCEAIELLMSLGATDIRVEHVSGWSKERLAQIALPLGAAGDIATFDGSANSSGYRSMLYSASLPGSQRPVMPSNLVWYAHEPTWQAVARGRLDFGLNQFSLSVTYEDDFGINAGLKAKIASAGFEIGGKFEDHQSTIWRINGSFSS